MSQGGAASLSYAMQDPRWQTLAEFTLPNEPGSEHLAVQQVAAAVRGLYLPSARLKRLKATLAQAVLNIREHETKNRPDWPVSIRVLALGARAAMAVPETDQEQAGPMSEPEIPDPETRLTDQPSRGGWGFFLIDKRVDELGVTGDRPHHILELFLYLEVEQRGSERY